MGDAQSRADGPDLTAGVPLADLPDGGMLQGQVNGEAVLLVRNGDEIHAVGASCTHYGAPLADGVLDGNLIRCPWHHACFDIGSGRADRPPALDGLRIWEVERSGDLVRVRAPGEAPPSRVIAVPGLQNVRILIIGAGAAGNAAAEMLRRIGHYGPIMMFGADESIPYDRPNLSKDYLAGTANEEWIPLRSREFYSEKTIDLRTGISVESLNIADRKATLSSGETIEFDRALLATGAIPVPLPVPGGDLPHVRYLRTLADSRAIIELASSARNAVVIGASFIGLECAAALRARDVDVRIVAPEHVPLARILGEQVGRFVESVHRSHGVEMFLGHTVESIDAGSVTLDDGRRLSADLVVVGIGVRPQTELAEKAGLKVDQGVVVDDHLQTSSPEIFAAGDIARFPDALTGELVRIEHWAVAEQQGQCAAKNMVGADERYTTVPFFWSNHYDKSVSYVGHAEGWDSIEVSGDVQAGDALVGYRKGGRILAVASVGRQKEALQAGIALERREWDALDALVASSR